MIITRYTVPTMKDEQKPKRHIAEQFNFVFDEPKVDLSIEAVQKRREEAQREAVRKAAKWSPESH